MNGLNPPNQDPSLAPYVGGVVQVLTPQQVLANERRAAETESQAPVMVGLAAYVRKCWDSANMAKRMTIEQRMLQSIRQRNGEYDPDVLSEIKRSGGSDIYMMLTSQKCRAASSWLKDVLLAAKDERPWAIQPTKEPSLSPEDMEDVVQDATTEALQLETMMGMEMLTKENLHDLAERVRDRILVKSKDEAKEMAERMESRMEDQLQEGGFFEQFSEFLDDIVTFPAAIIKGPVVRRKPTMSWVQGPEGYELKIEDTLTLNWERVDPLMAYPAAHSSDIDDGFFIERHHLTRVDLQHMRGVEGYSDAAIASVLDEYGQGGLREWLYVDTAKAAAEGKSVSAVYSDPEQPIDAVQFWGNVQGKDLLDWGMSPNDITDSTKDYACEVWLIGRWVIKATLNYDPLGRKPYYKASYEEVPGGFWGNSVADLVRDCQSVCNSAARSLVNNMGIASGPQVGINVERLPKGEDVTQMYPWQIRQFVSDPYGSTAPPIVFFQPDMIAEKLMGIYEKFSVLADEYSGVPRYMTGDASPGGAGRTASGMSMMMSNAGKAIKQVVSNIDIHVMSKLIERLYFYNMKYGTDEALKGDVRIVARGAGLLIVKEQAQVRKNEFLNIVASNPVFADIIGEEAMASLLREAAKGLDMDLNQVVPPPEVIRARVAAKQKAMMQQQALEARANAMPSENISFQRDASGAVQGASIMPRNKQTLSNGGAVTDNFAPARQ